MRPMIYPMQLTDYSHTSAAAWRRYLQEKYRSVDVLNQKWMTSHPDFDAIPVPSPAERVYLPDGETMYPASVADYNTFRSVETADALITLARFAKELIGRNRVVGAFYGYAGTRFGHDAIDRVLNSPAVDFLASPFAYDTQRAPGTDWILQGALGSTRLHHKLWFTECDVRTHLSRPLSQSMPHANPIGNTLYDGPIWYGPDSEEVSICQMRKAVAKTICMGAGMWWFDMWGGWFHTDACMDTIRKSKELYQTLAQDTSVAQVAIVCDTYARCTYTDNASLEKVLQAISRSGVAYEQFSLTDLDKLDPGQYKSLVLLNVHTVAPALTRWKNGHHSIVYIASASDPDMDGTRCPCESGSVYIGHGYQEYFLSDLPSPRALREAFLMSGAHIYTFSDDMIYAYGKMVAMHAASDGEKRIFLPEKRNHIKDVYTGETLVPCGHFFDFPMKKGETSVFRVE
jgi:beta-galactosidase